MKANGIGCWSNEKGRRLRKDEIKQLKERIAHEQEIRPDGVVTDPKLIEALKKKRKRG